MHSKKQDYVPAMREAQDAPYRARRIFARGSNDESKTSALVRDGQVLRALGPISSNLAVVSLIRQPREVTVARALRAHTAAGDWHSAYPMWGYGDQEEPVRCSCGRFAGCRSTSLRICRVASGCQT
jgi:hypothetical protein